MMPASLTPAQRAALEYAFACGHVVVRGLFPRSTIAALERRGLLVDNAPADGWRLTDAGRAALEESR